MSLPYNRALHPDDYHASELAPHIEDVRAFERRVREKSVPYRKDHTHREWEYGNILRQLRELITADHAGEVDFTVPDEIRILDTGFGANYFTLALRDLGYRVEAADSADYGDPTQWLIQQCQAFGFEIPLHVGRGAALESMTAIPDQTFDVTLCISTIEHVAAVHWDAAWNELRRVTKMGGLVMVTTDYFATPQAWEASPFKDSQHTVVEPDFLDAFLSDIDLKYGFKVVGGVDLTYRGDFVNNYSFVNLCFRRER